MISRQLHSILAARYGIKAIYSTQVLEGGEWKNLLRIESDRGVFVLSTSHPTTVVEGIAFEHDLLSYLNNSFSEVPAPIAGYDGTTYFVHDNLVVTLFPFMPGKVANDELESVRIEAARMLARLHRAFIAYSSPASRPGICALRELDWNHNQWWNWDEVLNLLSGNVEKSNYAAQGFLENGLPFTPEIVRKKSYIEREKEVLNSWIKGITESDRSPLFAPTHGDYYARNLLVENSRVSAVVDWDECRADWLAFELARAILNFCGGEGTLNEARSVRSFREKAISFLDAYQTQGGPVPFSEFDLLIPFMRCVCLIDTLFTFGAFLKGGVWNSAHAEYHLNNLISLQILEDVRLFS